MKKPRFDLMGKTELPQKSFLYCIFCGSLSIVSFIIPDEYPLVLRIKIKCDNCKEEFSCQRNTIFWLIENSLKNPINKKIFKNIFGERKEVALEKDFLRQQKFIRENGRESFLKLGNIEIPKPKIFWNEKL